MSSSPHHFHHAKEKAIRKAQSEETILKDKKVPSKKILKENLTSAKVNAEMRGKAASRKISKRASPDMVNVDTMPQHLHKEGLKWIKAIKKQISEHTRDISRKLMRHVKSYRGK
jgi:hypothetical protein